MDAFWQGKITYFLPAFHWRFEIKPEKKDNPVAALTHHVVAGGVMAADVVKLDAAEAVQGQVVIITAVIPFPQSGATKCVYSRSFLTFSPGKTNAFACASRESS